VLHVAKIVCCTGDFGSGKSNFASFLGVELARSRRCPLWANYSLLGSLPVRSVVELFDCKRGVLVLDELHDTIDSRSSSGMANAGFLEWFMQCRKQESDVLFMTQVLDQVDKRVRRMVKAEFCFSDLNGSHSQVECYRINLDGERESRISSKVWDRRLAYGLYNHLERAWRLEAPPKAVAGGPGERPAERARTRS
jgi:hypothetical protein